MFWMGFIVGCGAGSIIVALVLLYCVVKMTHGKIGNMKKIERYWEISIERMAEYSENMAAISKAIQDK